MCPRPGPGSISSRRRSTSPRNQVGDASNRSSSTLGTRSSTAHCVSSSVQYARDLSLREGYRSNHQQDTYSRAIGDRPVLVRGFAARLEPDCEHAADARPIGCVVGCAGLALVNFAMADGFIAGFEAKYRFRFWRPETAIRAGGDRRQSADRTGPGMAAVPHHAAGAGLSRRPTRCSAGLRLRC